MTERSQATKLSILIILKGRKDHLLHVLAGLEVGTYLPHEVVIVQMNEVPYHLSTSLNVRQVSLQADEPLPLAAARNRAAATATGDLLLFLDVDCIPDRNCLEQLISNADTTAITMADPYYMKQAVTSIHFEAFEREATASAVRQSLAYGYSNTYELFWSLGFMMSAQTFELHGGFDESFKGYGGEDTDFAFTARAKKIPLIYSPAKVFHQPHPSYDPPLNWLEDIVENARTFYAKWGTWPMEGWLNSFAKSEYITRTADTILIQKLPSETEINAAR